MPYIYKSGLQFGINETNIYGGASYVELTQAEYDALSDAEKHNGQIYFITDGNYDFLIVNDSVPIGSIQAYGGMSAPTNWLICDGRAVSRTDYKELFKVIGVFFGEGDGATTFNLPDLTGRVAIGHNDTYSLGAQGGNKDAIIPYHNHSIASSGACTTNSTSKTLTGDVWNMAVQSSSQNLTTTGIFSARTTTEGVGYTSSTNQRQDGFHIDATHSHGIPNHTHTVNYAGTADNTVDANMQPYLVTNYIIKAKNPSITSGQQLQAMELFYPVGSYFETSDSTFDPNIEWGGTWVSTGANIYEEKKLLWTNSNPTAVFNAQTLSLDLTAYDYVEIGARWMATYDGTIKYQKFSIGNSYGTYLVIPVGANDGVSDTQRYNSMRAITINTNGIVFKSGGYYRWSATDQGSSETYAVPIKIFGIKELTQYKWHRTA